jgi:hypothetical protein
MRTWLPNHCRTYLILVTVPVLLLFFRQLLKQAATDDVLYPDQAGILVILVEDYALPNLLVQMRAVMMGLHLPQCPSLPPETIEKEHIHGLCETE